MTHQQSPRHRKFRSILQWVLSVLAFAVVWGIFFFICAVFRPALEWFYMVLPLLLSIVVFTIIYRALRPHQSKAPQPPASKDEAEPPSQPLSYEEQILAEAELYLDLLKKLTLQVIDYSEQVATQAARLQKALEQMIRHLRTEPQDAVKIRRCVHHYLPSVVKFLQTYIKIHRENIKGNNTGQITSNIEGILYTTANAFEHLTDQLYEDDVMDISTDISVLEQLLKQEGYLEEELNNQ